MEKLAEAYEDYTLLINILEGKMDVGLYYFQRGDISKGMGHYSRAIKDLKKAEQSQFVNSHDVDKLIGFCYQK